MEFGQRRGVYVNVKDLLKDKDSAADSGLIDHLEQLDLIYRTMCGILYNFVPTSGHPGGSISCGRIVESLLYHTMSYDMLRPDEETADLISYAAGHKAMGLYAMWALRNELVRQYDEKLLPTDTRHQLRLEDLLGFRRNPTQSTPLIKEYNAKPLDGHPTPVVPFVKLSTGASGVGLGSSFGLGVGARDYYGENAPFVHVLEGEGGLTPGRTHEAMASIATAQVNNIIVHLDWNQSSIDSNMVCREGDEAGDYVQWDPMEYAYLHDWNVIFVPCGFDFKEILAAQKLATSLINNQPTFIVYRTVKGWKYGIEGRASHGAGHKFCSDEFYATLKPFEDRFEVSFPRRQNEVTEKELEELYFDYLLTVRHTLRDKAKGVVAGLGERLGESAIRLSNCRRKARIGAPEVGKLYGFSPESIPTDVVTAPGQTETLRGSLGNVLGYLNMDSNGSLVAAAADLAASTSIDRISEGYPDGFWNAVSNPRSRLMAVGGICEDAMGALFSGLSAYGRSVGVASSYGAFIAALQHIAARLHCIGQQGRNDYSGAPGNPFFLVCAHAGLKTGEDGPTHADPQPLQLLQENFPHGSLITLTPWDPNEMWPVVIAALNHRPGVIVPFVTRPPERIFDREALKIPSVESAAKGIYAIRTADASTKEHGGTLIIQGSGVMNTFVEEVLPRIDENGLNMNVYYISSVELFNYQQVSEQEKILPHSLREEAMGVTGFTMPTMYRWILSEEGRRRTLHPFAGNRYLGSGEAHKVLEEAGLHGEGQWKAVLDYVQWIRKKVRPFS